MNDEQQKAVKELRSMAAQILSPRSTGKHFFNSVADMLEQSRSNQLQREVQLRKALDDLAAEKALRERVQEECDERRGAMADIVRTLGHGCCGLAHNEIAPKISVLIQQREQAQRERNELQAKLDARENEIDEEWLNAIAVCWNRFFGRPFDTRDGETADEGRQANIGAIFQELEDAKAKLTESKAELFKMAASQQICVGAAGIGDFSELCGWIDSMKAKLLALEKEYGQLHDKFMDQLPGD